jgi:hypothetical protein
MKKQFFAQLDDNNVVIAVHCVTQEFLDANPDRYPGTWVETFFDTDNKIYAGVGYTYDETTQDFVAPYVEPIDPNDEQ